MNPLVDVQLVIIWQEVSGEGHSVAETLDDWVHIAGVPDVPQSTQPTFLPQERQNLLKKHLQGCTEQMVLQRGDIGLTTLPQVGWRFRTFAAETSVLKVRTSRLWSKGSECSTESQLHIWAKTMRDSLSWFAGSFNLWPGCGHNLLLLLFILDHFSDVRGGVWAGEATSHTALGIILQFGCVCALHRGLKEHRNISHMGNGMDQEKRRYGSPLWVGASGGNHCVMLRRWST